MFFYQHNLTRKGVKNPVTRRPFATTFIWVLLQFPCEIDVPWEAPLPRSTRDSAALRLLKVESGINGFLPTSWGPSLYSVSLLIRLRYALEEVTVFCVRQLCARSSRPAAKRKIKACNLLHSRGKNAAA